MPKVFLTGRPKIGKTTVLLKCIKLLKRRKIKVGGIITPELKEGGERIGFRVIDINSGKSEIFASKLFKQGIRFGRYRIDLRKFENIALPALEKAMKESKVVCIDEIGKMELMSRKFYETLKKILDSEIDLIATLHRHLTKDFRNFGRLIVVNEENRDTLPFLILKILKV